MLKIGFTGTRHGMSNVQKKELKKIVDNKDFCEFHHGRCVGSDEQAHEYIETIKDARSIKIVGHPPKFKGSMSHCKCDYMMKADEYLKRNHNIVDHTDILIATPDTKEKLRSGTWSTIRYARKKEKRIYIIHKNGRVTIE